MFPFPFVLPFLLPFLLVLVLPFVTQAGCGRYMGAARYYGALSSALDVLPELRKNQRSRVPAWQSASQPPGTLAM